jgi:competence ComEA-like helix-hairpin-helix protein
MRWLLEWTSRLGFTPREVRVILVLTATLLAGVGLRHLPFIARRANPVVDGESYAESDSEFFARAKATFPDSADTPRTPRQQHAPAHPGIVELNTAGREQLMQLPGIKGAYADRILAYRATHGPFARIDDLLLVKGIGAKRLERLRPFVTVTLH